MSDQSKFSVDFSKAYGKFTYFASISIFISVLELEKTSSILGLKSASLNERWVETAFFLAGVTLAWNYLTRFMDEKRVYFKLDQGVSAAQKNVRKTTDSLALDCQNTIDSLEDFERYLDIYQRFMEERGLVEFEADNSIAVAVAVAGGAETRKINYEVPENPNIWPSSRDQRLIAVRKIIRELAGISEILEEVSTGIDRAADEMVLTKSKVDQLLAFIINPVNYIGWAKWRFLTIEVILPVFLFGSMCWAYLYPNEVFGFIEWFGDVSILRDKF